MHHGCSIAYKDFVLKCVYIMMQIPISWTIEVLHIFFSRKIMFTLWYWFPLVELLNSAHYFECKDSLNSHDALVPREYVNSVNVMFYAYAHASVSGYVRFIFCIWVSNLFK